MDLGQKTVDDVVAEAVKGSLLLRRPLGSSARQQPATNIPEFQRGFEWQPQQVRKLVESLHRDYPIGTMLLWDPPSEYEVARVAEGVQTRHWIVDGQQRTTALCLVFGQKPYWWPDAASWNEQVARIDVLANVTSADSELGELDFALANPIKSQDPNWLSVRRVLSCQDEKATTALAFQIAAEGNAASDPLVVQRLMSVISSIWSVRARPVPIVTVKHDLEDVAEIFARLNQAGTRVTEADVTVALIAAHNPGWIRDEFLRYAEDMKEQGYDLEPGVYIRTLTGVSHGTARLKDLKADFWKGDVRQVWDRTKKTISRTIHLLGDRGILSAELLPSRNSLIPLFAFQDRFGDALPFSRMLYWFLLANADGRYSGSSTTTLSQDLAAIQNAPTGEHAFSQLLQPLKVPTTVEPDRFLEDYRRSQFSRLLLYLLLFDHAATDWVSKVRIGYEKGESALYEGFLPEWHHIFPQAQLRRAGRNQDDINVLANITVMNETTNRHKLRAKTPADYVEQFGITAGDLERHFVPADAPLSIEKYDDFVLRRAELLSQEATAYLKHLREG